MSKDPHPSRIFTLLLVMLFFLFSGLALAQDEDEEVMEVDNETCLDCHNDPDPDFTMEKGDKEIWLHVDPEKYEASVHSEELCVSCHVGFDPEEEPHLPEIKPVDCAECHDDVTEVFDVSEHGRALAKGDPNAPNCVTCHGTHDIMYIDEGESMASRNHEVETCLSCHVDNEDVKSKMTHDDIFISDYQSSVHGRLHAEGDMEAAICSDCHGAHSTMKASNPNSRVNKFNIAETCGHCHDEVKDEFVESIHGQALAKGIEDAATCTDCHGEHEILEPDNEKSRVAAQNVSEQVCGSCHGSLELNRKYGLASDRFSGFNDSYHGLAIRFGNVEVANCASCHGIHDILPSENPASMINPANLAETCGSCHPGANENFASGSIHSNTSTTDTPLAFWITTIYIGLIVTTIGFMFTHNILDYYRKLKNQYKERYFKPVVAQTAGEPKSYMRMTPNERIQHFLLAGSFIMLTITGFMLKFPEAWWVSVLREGLGEWTFGMRNSIHRISAVIMIGVSLYHVYYLIFTKRGRKIFTDMLPIMKDVRDLFGMFSYNAGFAKDHPKFHRFNYIEKLEYWAVIWGTIVMSLTGLMLWFENHSMSWFGKYTLDISELIHYYEAWLAFLAIVVWHFYYVIFNPDVYPMNFSWLNGKVSEREMAKEHPLELEEIKKEEARNK
ncbi:MAG TPA: cytochrome b/b6 domain-containing protein [Calditrichia bacterium]|nr:cytochrome b/b6 domain-containing protein [Calditrichia bacterium]